MKNSIQPLILLISLLVFPLLAISGDFDFPNSSTLTVNNWPYKVISVDVNNDGKADIVTASEEYFTVYMGQGDGTFLRNDYAYQSAGQIGVDMCAIDINKDSYIDFAFSNETSEYMAYMTFVLNDGSGGFSSYQHTNTYNGFVSTDIDVADIDNDGYDDIVTASTWSGALNVYLNNNSGNFDSSITIDLDKLVYCITSADFDNDDDMDLASATLSYNDLFINLNNGDSTFADTVRYPSFFSSYSITAADFNNDSYPDLVTSIETGEYMGYVALFMNNGTGQFNLTTTINIGGKSDEAIAADFNNDNYLDIAAVADDQHLVLLKNDQSGGFSIDTTYTVGSFPSSVASADFDSDGKADVVVANQNDNNLTLFLTSGTGSCCEFVGDLNHSGSIPDISDLLYLVDYMFDPGSPAPICMAEGDINGDGSSVPDITDLIYFIDYMFVPGSNPLPDCL